MNPDGKFWVAVWALVATVVITMAAIISGYYTGKNQCLVELVKVGADPVEAACVLDDGSYNQQKCTAIAIAKELRHGR